MRDNQMLQVLLPIVIDGLTARGITGVSVAQSYQPTQQGAASGRSVYIHKLGDNPVGHTGRSNEWNVADQEMEYQEIQAYQTNFQVNAMAIQDPSDINSITASDILKSVRQILQSSQAIELLRSNNLGILRISDLTNTPFVDDKGRYEYDPSFDFTLTHDDIFTSTSPVTESIEYNIYRV